jgi:MIP family channel proteins
MQMPIKRSPVSGAQAERRVREREAMRTTWNPIIAEATGTFLFLFIGIGSAAMIDWSAVVGQELPGLLIVALAHGIALAVMVSALGAVSGGHFNPAVTFGVWLAGRISSMNAARYVIAQLLGGLLAAWSIRAIFSEQVSSNLGRPALGSGIEPLAGAGIEAVLTAVLAIAVFGTAIDPRGPKIGGLAIGLALGAGILMGGPLTGGALNPARWFGPAAVTGVWTDGWIWIVGPLVGAGVAALAFRYFFLPEADLRRTPAEPTPPSA